jgi:serine/threonine-protein kinase RsbW
VEIKLVLYLPREAVSVPVTRQVLDSCLQTLGVTPDTRADIALALGEACANVIQHAGPGEEYEVQVSARNRRCAIEVVNSGSRDSEPLAIADDPVPATAERGRGLKIIDAVVDNLQLTRNDRRGRRPYISKRRWSCCPERLGSNSSTPMGLALHRSDDVGHARQTLRQRASHSP